LSLNSKIRSWGVRSPLPILLGIAIVGLIVLPGREGGQKAPQLIDESSFVTALAATLKCETTVSEYPQYAAGSGEPSPEEALRKWSENNKAFQLSTLGAPTLFDRSERLVGYVMSSPEGVRLTAAVGRTTSGWVIDGVEACREVVRP
jgi:hypothetical protein